jgi:1-acyl-sn-glycerol-3-phosphate acyltransferase
MWSARRVGYRAIKLILTPLVWLLTRPRITGRGVVPPRGPAVIAANHVSMADSFVLCLVVRRKLTFVAKSEYFTGTGLRGGFLRWFFRTAGQVPVDRSGGGAGDAALDAARRLLHRGGLWAIHPEGSRSPDGRLHRGRTGLMRVALDLDVPVIPVVLAGTDRVHRRGSRWPTPSRVHVTFLPPLDLSRWRGRAADPEAVREATDALMRELARASGQEYVDRYAA